MAVSTRTAKPAVKPKVIPAPKPAKALENEAASTAAAPEQDITEQTEGLSTTNTAPNEVKNDPGATGDKTIDESRVAAHQEALAARDGDNAKSDYAGTAADDATDSDDDNGTETETDEDNDGVAEGTSFTHGKVDYNGSELPVIHDRDGVDRLADGAEFFAAFLHNPAVSDDHYAVINILPDLRSGKVSRRGLSAGYWDDEYKTAPPKARRDVKARGGFTVIS